MIRQSAVLVFFSLLVGCPNTESSVQKSVTVEATREIGQTGVGHPSVVEEATVEAVFSGSTPRLPAALGALQFGMEVGSARAAVEISRDPEVPLFELDREDTLVLGGQLPNALGTGFSVILKDGVLAEVDVSIPSDDALSKLEGLWGPAEKDLKNNTVEWKNTEKGLRVVLFNDPETKAVVKFVKQAK